MRDKLIFWRPRLLKSQDQINNDLFMFKFIFRMISNIINSSYLDVMYILERLNPIP